MHRGYRSPAMRELRDQQARYAPRERKIDQARRAEQLIDELDDRKSYAFDFLCYRLTSFRPESLPREKLLGDDAKHDLRLFIEDVSDAADIAADQAGEPVLTVEQLAKEYSVSTKTVARWRERGLVSRRLLFDGRKRVGFLRSSVERFVAEHGADVERGRRFSQMNEPERDEIVRRARRLARAGGGLSEVARRVARRLGRSVEAVRYSLRQFDREHPDLAVFPDVTGPFDDSVKHRVFQEYRRGTSVDELARQYGRTRTTIYRAINEQRARRIGELPLDCIDNPLFARANAEKTILGPPPVVESTGKRAVRPPSGLPPYLASLYEVPLLTREQEAYLFRKFNYLKYKAAKLRKQLDPARARTPLMDDIERLYEQAVAVKNQIIRANLRLVVSIAKRHVGPNDSFFDLVSDGNMSLIRAVEKFDFARGNKFSTYATWAIMKNFARTIPDELRRRDRFRTSLDEAFTATEDVRSDPLEQEGLQHLREEQVGKILNRLDEREQQIIVSRFGLGRGREPLTLKEVGAEIGVTKERVRQIEARALSKLRQAATEERIELPDE